MSIATSMPAHSRRFNPRVYNIAIMAFNKDIADAMRISIQDGYTLPPRTAYNQAICRKIMARDGHLVVNALAGTGKSTQIKHVCSDFPDASITVRTSHSFGINALNYHMTKRMNLPKIDVKEDKVDVILSQLLNLDQLNADETTRANTIRSIAVRIVSLMKSQGYIAIRPEATDDDLAKLTEHFDIELPDDIPAGDIFDTSRQALRASNTDLTTADYEDMIYLPVLMGISFYQNDLIMIDEAQDLNAIQIAMIKQMAGSRGQCVFVGDRFQSIYGFRGAGIDAIQSIVAEFDAAELPLSTCWRCPTAVIREAQQIVPDIEASPNAIEGSVKTVGMGEFRKGVTAGDFVLCRTTAPLVDICMGLIRAGKAATVRGRDIGQGLINLASKIARRRNLKGSDLVDSLVKYRDEQMKRLAHPSKEAQRQSMEDKLDTLLVIAEDCSDFSQLRAKIESIFSDTDGGRNVILCSTAHKAKGLEAENVWIIRPELMPFPFAKKDWQIKQEWNLRYVSITRSTRNLFYVETEPEN